MEILDFWCIGLIVSAKRILLLTGAPAVGKTTVLLKTVDALKAKGIGVGGMVSREVREGGVRVGFEVIDVATGGCGWLAHVGQKAGPKVGKYHVNLADLDGLGAKTIVQAIGSCSVVVIDEIGPMELFSDKFKQAVKDALASDVLVLGVVHARVKDPLVDEAKQRVDAEVYVVTVSSRESLAEALTQKILGLVCV